MQNQATPPTGDAEDENEYDSDDTLVETSEGELQFSEERRFQV